MLCVGAPVLFTTHCWGGGGGGGAGAGVVKQTVGGLVLTPASASQPCSCSSALSLTSHHVLLKPFLHHRRSTPAPPYPTPPSHPPSGQNTPSSIRAVSLRQTASGHSELGKHWFYTCVLKLPTHSFFGGGGQTGGFSHEQTALKCGCGGTLQSSMTIKAPTDGLSFR